MNLNPEKIRLMARLAILEKENGRGIRNVRESYRSDYIGIPVFKNLLRVTVVFALIAGIWAVCHLGQLLDALSGSQLRSIAVGLAVFYLIMMIITAAVTYAVYAASYRRNKQDTVLYQELLEELDAVEKEDVFEIDAW